MLAGPAPASGANPFPRRQQLLEVAADEARTMLAGRRVLLDSAETVAAFAEEMSTVRAGGGPTRTVLRTFRWPVAL